MIIQKVSLSFDQGLFVLVYQTMMQLFALTSASTNPKGLADGLAYDELENKVIAQSIMFRIRGDVASVKLPTSR